MVVLSDLSLVVLWVLHLGQVVFLLAEPLVDM